MCVKSTVISACPNWLRSIDKRGNSIQSLSATYQLRGATEAGLFSLIVIVDGQTTDKVIPVAICFACTTKSVRSCIIGIDIV